MFTLEESALLSRMLRFLWWTLLAIALAALTYVFSDKLQSVLGFCTLTHSPDLFSKP